MSTIARSAAYGGTRTVALCDWKHAKEIVERNMGDIFECSYMLAVIESVVVNTLYNGIGHLDQEAYWYRWYGTSEKGQYHPIVTPKAYVGAVRATDLVDAALTWIEANKSEAPMASAVALRVVRWVIGIPERRGGTSVD